MNKDESEKINEIQRLQNDVKKWSDETFGIFRTGTPIAHHLKKEINELIDALSVIHNGIYTNDPTGQEGLRRLAEARHRIKMEYADCLTLLLDSAAHENLTIDDLTKASQEKLEINKKRKWGTPDENGVIEHIKE
jgi:hypothetical protein